MGLYRATVIRTVNGQKVNKRTRTWYGSYTAHGRRFANIALGTTNKVEAARKLVEIMARDGADGGRRARRDMATLPLVDHIDHWHQSILNEGRSETHADKLRRNVLAIVKGCAFARARDIHPERAAQYILEMRVKRGRNKTDWTPSICTCNHYRQAFAQFCRWLTMNKRGPVFDLHALKLADARRDRHRERRALDAEEARRLIAAALADDAQDVAGITGRNRARLYRVSLATGVRSGRELTGVTWPNFRIDGNNPRLTLPATITKSGNVETVPIKPAFAVELRPWRAESADPAGRAFRTPHSSGFVDLIRHDLDAARTTWLDEAENPKEHAKRERSDFLRYQNRAGAYADFYALRHSFISWLANAGTPPRTLQQLARHASIETTLKYYTHTTDDHQAAAVDALPDLGIDSEPRVIRKSA